MSASPVRIAVVDDDPAVLESTQFLLEAEGHSVGSFASGSDLFKTLAASPFDGLILDHHMPGLTGLEVARLLRASGHNLPIMLISGAMTVDIASRAAEIGVEKVVDKPVSDDELMSFVALVKSGGQGVHH